MNRTTAIFWNISRCALILFCGRQLLIGHFDCMAASRILSNAGSAWEHSQIPSKAPEKVMEERNRTAQIFLERGASSSLNWLIPMFALALIPYASTRRVERLTNKVTKNSIESA